MGRLSHLTRLALGRSAFGDPVRDENGDIAVDPSAFKHDAAGYQQQFDSRGHPVNEETLRSERGMRRAQNEVLQLVGVVRSKHHQKQQLARRHSLSDNELIDMVNYENVVGSLWNALIPLPLELSAWYIMSFRKRLCTFRSYLEPGVMAALRSERRLLGNASFFCSGLGYSLIADEIQDYRCWLNSALRRRPTTSHDPARPRSGTSRIEGILEQLKDLGLFAIEWTIRTRGTLQSLGLIPFQQVLPWYHVLTLLSTSPLLYLNRPADLSVSAPLSLLAGFLCSPFLAAYLLHRTRQTIESGIYSLLRLEVARPDNPDALSLSGRLEEVEGFAGYALGSGFNISKIYDVDPGLSFWGRTRAIFPILAKAMDWVSFSRRRVSIDPSVRGDLLQASRQRYMDLVRSNQRLTYDERVPDDQLRRDAISQAFAEALIDPRGSLINITQWADDISTDDGVSTATPDPEDLFPSSRQPPDHAVSTTPGSPALTIDPTQFIPAVPLGTLLEAADVPEVIMPAPPSPSTPEPGISRAASLTQTSNHPSSAPRPVRRPTELDENVSHMASSVRWPGPPPDYIHSPAGVEHDPSLPQHRVTLLSAFPPDTFTRCGSSLITSIMLLPLEVYYTRYLAMTFLNSATTMNIGIVTVARDIAPLRPSWDIFSVGTLMLTQKAMLTFGIEALLKGIVWGISTKLCMWVGKKHFLWGVA